MYLLMLVVVLLNLQIKLLEKNNLRKMLLKPQKHLFRLEHLIQQLLFIYLLVFKMKQLYQLMVIMILLSQLI
jgi:hypothetical protein